MPVIIPRVKICGITRLTDALDAAAAGAWAVGFVFYRKSPRYVGPFKVRRIIQSLPPFITPVGVFVNHPEGAVRDIAAFCGLKTLQFHGDESPAYLKRFRGFTVIKAIRPARKIRTAELSVYPAHAFLFDTPHENLYGGTGQPFDLNWIVPAKNMHTPMIVAGGLNAQRAASVFKRIRPFAVDVSSAVEDRPGEKNKKKIKDFFSSLYYHLFQEDDRHGDGSA